MLSENGRDAELGACLPVDEKKGSAAMTYQFDTRYRMEEIAHMVEICDIMLQCSHAHISCDECPLVDELCFTVRNRTVKDAMYLLLDLLSANMSLPHEEKTTLIHCTEPEKKGE